MAKKNNQFYTFKFKSGRLKEFNYDIELEFDEAKDNNEVISLFDNQVLRSIRKITNRKVDFERVEYLKREIKRIKKLPHSEENALNIMEYQREINEYLYIPEYITIVMDHKSHYDYLYENKLKLNGKTYKRFTCGAGMARVSTVAFCDSDIIDELNEILDNGRNKEKEMIPSKYNAYKGLYGSATLPVSTPKFCVVKDYESPTEVEVDFVEETPKHEDDIVKEDIITEMFNRFDGMGLISVRQSKKWADELGLDYIPAQWCIRQSFCKGMLSTFDIHDFCEKENRKNYNIETIYTDENGDNIIVDIREVDVILTESQLKLWDSWDSIEDYQNNCELNDLKWGISLYTPKKDKDILNMNYQFLQTVDLSKSDIEDVCKKFVDWISGVTSKDIYYTMLFLLGDNITEEKVLHYIEESDNHWVKSLIIAPEMINDKYIKKKIYDLIKKKIKDACLGKIIVDGNFQVIVSDPYAMMQHVCGLEVTGLLGKNEYYSNYWIERGVKIVDAMRAPLTYRSEHVLLDLKKNEKLDYWFKYNYTGIILNVHGEETMRFAGSDFDYDIVATTSDKSIIKGVYEDALPIGYKPSKGEKINFTDRNLFESDKFSFGSIIGSITNKSTSGYALLEKLDEKSKEYEITLNRIKMSTRLQNAQIDKAKLGREVKGIPENWTKRQKINKDDSEEVKKQKELINNTLLDKHPYFFIYLYKDTKNKYNKHMKTDNLDSKNRFGMDLEKLKSLKRKNEEQREFLKYHYERMPVIDSDCVMNNLCRYIESIDFGIRNIMNKDIPKDIYNKMVNDNYTFNEDTYEKIKEIYDEYKVSLSQINLNPTVTDLNKVDYDENLEKKIQAEYDNFQKEVSLICSNEIELTNYMIYMHYVEKPSYNKEVLWKLYGECIFENIKSKSSKVITIPVLDENGDIEYLNKHYKLKEVSLIDQ